ncbi:esterase-like activity of phytase family protein [Allosphingosinicella deserti]|nr:esterase-like activity of phytase family protein [Sphingomonas deserti]
MSEKPSFTLQRLGWTDEILDVIDCPGGAMTLRASYGSGLARRPDDPPGIVWAVGDRGPNLKIKTLLDLYGLEHLRPLAAMSGAKIMPRTDLGPALARLQVVEDRIKLAAVLRLRDGNGVAVSGLPMPHGDHAISEPALDMDGQPISADPSGLDTEGIVALPDGSFFVGDEFGPSLVHVGAGGDVIARFVPANVPLGGARYPVRPILPAIASRRQINRGFEAIAVSADGAFLFLAFQSPLAHPDPQTHAAARHVRLWKLDAATLRVRAQYLYPLDPPESFLRDARDEAIGWSDLKVSELVWLGEDSLLVLERASRTTKLYRVDLRAASALGSEHLDIETRPTIEELSAAAAPLPELDKRLLFTSDDVPELPADIEGVAVLSPRTLLLVNDNDFGVEGAETSFWRLEFADPVLA